MARQSVLSPESRRIIQTERRSIMRQMANAAEKRIAQAREEMASARGREATKVRANNEHALVHGIRNVLSTVASSYGVLPPIDINVNVYSPTLEAWTDFSKVVIKYPHRLVPSDQVGSWRQDTLRNFYADVKGIGYHEIGHILHTVPFPTLLDLATEDGWVVPAPDPAIVGDPRAVLANSTVVLHSYWNLLEDQRMENAVVRSSPVMADYFTTMVLTHIADGHASHTSATWLLLVGRRYLPSSVRLRFQQMFADSYGVDYMHEAKDIVYRYMRATTPSEMMDAIVEMYLLSAALQVSMPRGTDGHGNPGPGNPGQSGEARETIRRSADTSTDDASTDDGTKPTVPGAPKSDDGESSDGESDGSGKATTDEDADDGSGDGSSDGDGSDESASGQDTDQRDGRSKQSGQGVGSEEPGDFDPSGPTPTMDELLQDIIDDLRDSLVQDSSLDEAVRATYETANTGDLVLPRTQRMHERYGPDFVPTAETVATGLEDALRVMTAENSPIWQTHQSRGVIDPFAYRTRVSGSTDYRRLYSEGDIGTDISVVLMLDTSGSMHGTDEGLGVAAYATKKACDALEVPCTVLTFDYEARIVWTSSEVPTPVCLSADGGTNPTTGLAALEDFSFDRSTQLVVVMTDGQFQDGVTVTRYGAPGRYFLGLGYGYAASTHYLDRVGFHESHLIQDLLEVPQIVANFLITFIH